MVQKTESDHALAQGRAGRVGRSIEITSSLEDAWMKAGQALRRANVHIAGQRSQQMWQVGDWLLEGEEHVFVRNSRSKVRDVAAEVTGYSKHTLAMAVSLSRRFAPATRVDGLSWWHHLATARLTQDEQRDWLTRAGEEEWSVERLRQQLKAAGRSAAGRPSRPGVDRAVVRLVSLTRAEIPDELLAQLERWWRREIDGGQDRPDGDPT